VIKVAQDDLKKPVRERYIHGYATTATGGQVIFTASAILLDRIHHAKTIFVDTTFKRSAGPLKEWEVAIYDNELQRALTIARVYSDRADRVQYKTIFDELQRVTLLITGRRLLLKRLSKGGTLLSIGVDLELSQALGAGDSFLPTNEPEYSGIHAETAEELLGYFIRACYTHAIRWSREPCPGVEDLKSHVPEDEFKRLRGFLYLKTKEKVDEFTQWVKSLNNPKVQAWWDHKLVNTWILPALIKCLSKITPEDWDMTASSTNVGESQHHYTNIHTGIQLSLLEAILKARELDEATALQVVQSTNSGVLKDSRGDTATRMRRSSARKTHAHKKASETRRKRKAQDAVDEELEQLQSAKQEAAKRIRVLKDEKARLSGRKGGPSKAESNSSGKVAATSRKRTAKASTNGGVEPQVSASVPKFKPSLSHAPILSTATHAMQSMLEPNPSSFASQQDVSMSTSPTAPQTSPLYPSAPSMEDTSLSDITLQANLYPQSQALPLYPQPPPSSSMMSATPLVSSTASLPPAPLGMETVLPAVPAAQWGSNSSAAACFPASDILYSSTASTFYTDPTFFFEGEMATSASAYGSPQPDVQCYSNDVLDNFLLRTQNQL
ncbi:hypothetical protein CVT26_002571, partial [Gymnopilus dilepis]